MKENFCIFYANIIFFLLKKEIFLNKILSFQKLARFKNLKEKKNSLKSTYQTYDLYDATQVLLMVLLPCENLKFACLSVWIFSWGINQVKIDQFSWDMDMLLK